MNQIYFLSEYNWERGELIQSNSKKNYKVKNRDGFIFYVSKDKCAHAGEQVCIVWETWKGKNGRGAYRVERNLYSEHRINAELISRQHISINDNNGRITESDFGMLQQ